MNIKQFFRRFFSHDYVQWDEYQAKIAFLEEYNWQQQTRKESIENMPGAGNKYASGEVEK